MVYVSSPCFVLLPYFLLFSGKYSPNFFLIYYFLRFFWCLITNFYISSELFIRWGYRAWNFFLKIKIAHPRYPSTRVSMQVPRLDIHFSPARYCRLIDLLDMFNGSWGSNDLITDGRSDSSSVPWYPADLLTNARVLVWRVWDFPLFIVTEIWFMWKYFLYSFCFHDTRELATVWLSGSLVSLSYLAYTFMFWRLKHLKTIKDVSGIEHIMTYEIFVFFSHSFSSLS